MYDINIEILRKELNCLMEANKPNQQKILKVSKELDKLIENYLEKKKCFN